jgi:hypothetical protein
MIMDRKDVNDKSLGAIIRDLSEDLSTLVRSEIALAKLEIRQSIGAAAAAGGMFIAALAIGIVALILLFITGILLLALVMPAWLATLLVALALLGVTAVLVILGKKKVESVHFVPTNTIDSVKTDVDMIKADLARVRQREA